MRRRRRERCPLGRHLPASLPPECLPPFDATAVRVAIDPSSPSLCGGFESGSFGHGTATYSADTAVQAILTRYFQSTVVIPPFPLIPETPGYTRPIVVHTVALMLAAWVAKDVASQAGWAAMPFGKEPSRHQQ